MTRCRQCQAVVSDEIEVLGAFAVDVGIGYVGKGTLFTYLHLGLRPLSCG